MTDKGPHCLACVEWVRSKLLTEARIHERLAESYTRDVLEADPEEVLRLWAKAREEGSRT